MFIVTFFIQVLICANKAITNIGKDRENLSILTDYEVVPLLIDLVNTVIRPNELPLIWLNIRNHNLIPDSVRLITAHVTMVCCAVP